MKSSDVKPNAIDHPNMFHFRAPTVFYLRMLINLRKIPVFLENVDKRRTGTARWNQFWKKMEKDWLGSSS